MIKRRQRSVTGSEGRGLGSGPSLGKSSQAGEEVETIVAMMSTFLNCVFLLL